MAKLVNDHKTRAHRKLIEHTCCEILLLIDFLTQVQQYSNQLACSSLVPYLVVASTFSILPLYPSYMPILHEDWCYRFFRSTYAVNALGITPSAD